MSFKPGDRVQLTDKLLSTMQERFPGLYQKISESGDPTGHLIDFDEEGFTVESDDWTVRVELAGSKIDEMLMPLPGGDLASTPEGLEPAKERLGVAQWFVSRIFELKQHVIVQDLHRNDDDTVFPDPTGEDWDEKKFRPARAELSAVEEQTYNAALRHIQTFVTGRVPAAHPELATEGSHDESAEPHV